MDWGSAERNDKGVAVPSQWLFLYYYEALNILFRFENALRVFVYVVLKRELGKDWDQAALGDGASIRSETRKRVTQAREHGYLGYEVNSPVMYLSSGELAEIMISDAYWRHFAPHFKAKKAVIQTKLQEIGTVRNSLAHFRPIKQDDVELIKQNVRHVLLDIEPMLTRILAVTDVVPTNSEAEWYKALKTIANQHVRVDLHSSRDQDWIRIGLTYAVPSLSVQMYGQRYCAFKLAKLRTADILRLCPHIQEACIYLSETPTYAQFVDDFKIQVSQTPSLVLPRSRLEREVEEIGRELRALAQTIERDVQLVTEDNLARGAIIHAVDGTATLQEPDDREAYWQFDTTMLASSTTETEFVEFWGKRIQFVDDFIATASRYPWMPVNVSQPAWYE